MFSGGKVWRIHCYSSLHNQPSNVSMISLTCYAEVDLRKPQHLLNRVTVGTGGGQRPCFWYWQNLVYAREGGPVGPKQPRTILIVRPGQSPVPLPPYHFSPLSQTQLLGICVHFIFLFKSPNRRMSQVLPIFRGFCEINWDVISLGTSWLRTCAVTLFQSPHCSRSSWERWALLTLPPCW